MCAGAEESSDGGSQLRLQCPCLSRQNTDKQRSIGEPLQHDNPFHCPPEITSHQARRLTWSQ